MIDLKDVWEKVSANKLLPDDVVRKHLELIDTFEGIFEPLVHCDVQGTLVEDGFTGKLKNPTYDLIKLLKENGRKIQIISAAGENAKYDLKAAGVSEEFFPVQGRFDKEFREEMKSGRKLFEMLIDDDPEHQKSYLTIINPSIIKPMI